MPKNIHKRHGENIHRMQQIPEKPTPSNSSALSRGSHDNIPSPELKHITHKKTTQQTKESSDEDKT